MKPIADRDGEEQVTRPITVLLVEDDVKVRRWIHESLERLGYNLLEAADGADALLIAELHRGPIHIVVTDVVMPRLNGPQLVKALIAQRPEARVLFISGYPEPFMRTGTESPEMKYYLQKPFDIDTLVNRITAILAD